MDAYWELSDFDIRIRQQGFENLLKSLENTSTTDDDEKSSTNPMNYALTRLIKGLVSNRKCARIGFAAALGTLANQSDKQLQVPNANEMISLVQNKLTTKKETGVEDAKNVRIGRVLGYIAIAYTQKDQDLTPLLETIVPDLLNIRKQETRRRLRTFIDASIVQLAKWSGRKVFKKEILPLIQNLLPGLWQAGDDGSTSIYLLVALANVYPKVFDEGYFKLHWNQLRLPLGTTTDEQAIIKKCLQSFDNELHLLEQLCRELLIYSMRTNQLSSLWPVLVDELSNIGFDSNKGHILLELMRFSFEENEESDCIAIIETIVDQSQSLFTKILDLFSSFARKNHLPESIALAKSMFDKLAETMKRQSLETRLRIFEKLLNCADKHYAGLQSVAKAVSEKLIPDEFLVYAETITKLFCSQSKEDDSSIDRRQHFLLEMLMNICDCASFDLKMESCGSIFETILSFCVLLNNFQVKNNHIPKQLRQVLHGNIELSDVTRQHLEDATYKLLMVEFQHQHYEHSFEVFRRVKHWCESTKHYSPLFTDAEKVQEYLKENGDTLLEVLETKSIKSFGDEKLKLAFQQAFILSFYDLFDDFKRAQQYIDDLSKCVNNAKTQLTGKKKSGDDSSWIEVFIDILLSLYTKKQHDIRSMVKKIYHHIVPYVNENALKLMLQSITPDDDDDDDTDNDDQEEDDEDKDEDEEEEKNEHESDSDAEDEDEELMETGEVNEELRKAVEKALGEAAAGDGDQDEPDMDDEAMLRLDPLLAEAFRSQIRKSSNTKIINEKLHHQFRVLDLIESVVKKDERMRFVLITIRPLIETLNSLPNSSAYKAMNERLDSILGQLSNRKIDHSDMPSTDECLELFRYLTSLTGSRMKLAIETLSKVSMFTIKLALHVGKLENRLAGVEELILTTYESGFLRYLLPDQSKRSQRKKHKKEENDDVEDESMSEESTVHPTIIKEFLSRFPEYRPRLMSLMVQTALKDTINWKKRNIVCGTLNNFFNKKQLENVDQDLLNGTVQLLVKLCNDSKSSKMESLHIITVLAQKLLLIRNPTLNEKQVSILLDTVSNVIKAKPINSDKQKKQLLNLLHSFRKRFQVTVDQEVLSMLTKKRKVTETKETVNQHENKKKKVKIDPPTVSNGDVHVDVQQPVKDCRQMPFKGISVKD